MKAKAKLAAGPPAAITTGPNAVKLSVNVTRNVGARLRRLAFDQRVSESSIVEIALEVLFSRMTDSELAEFLRERGASLRRTAHD